MIFRLYVKKSFSGEQKLEKEHQQTGPTVQKMNLVRLEAETATVIANVHQGFSVDLTTAEFFMGKWLIDLLTAASQVSKQFP